MLKSDATLVARAAFPGKTRPSPLAAAIMKAKDQKVERERA